MLSSGTQPAFVSCKYCKIIFLKKQKLMDHLKSVHDEETNSASNSVIVLVKMRTLYWPCLVIATKEDHLTVKSLKDDKLFDVKMAKTVNYTLEKLGETRNSDLKKSYTRAEDILKSNS